MRDSHDERRRRLTTALVMAVRSAQMVPPAQDHEHGIEEVQESFSVGVLRPALTVRRVLDVAPVNDLAVISEQRGADSVRESDSSKPSDNAMLTGQPVPVEQSSGRGKAKDDSPELGVGRVGVVSRWWGQRGPRKVPTVGTHRRMPRR